MRFLFRDYSLDTDRRELRRGLSQIPVEPQVFDLLEFLIRNRDKVVSRDELFSSVWGGRIVSESALDTRISAARSAIGDTGQRQLSIRTLPRKGVRFVESVREEQPGAASDQRPHVTAGATAATIAPLDRPSIAVLPFTNMSGDPEQDYFADGMSEEITTALCRCTWLMVIARNSSFTYKGKSVDVRQVGRELGARYIMEGSVRRSGERLRISGQLTDAISGAAMWADRFDGDRRDVFELQDRIAESVVAAIEPKLQLAEIGRIKARSETDLDAYDLFLRAQQLEYEFTELSLAKAIELLDQALAIDPSYAPAMALSAYCHAERRFQGWEVEPAKEQAKGHALALRAIELGWNDSNILWMAGYAIREIGGDAEQSMELIRRSLHLNPSSAIALTIAAWNEVVLGNPVSALERLDRAERLSPRDPRAWFMASAGALAHLTLGQFEQSAGRAKKALAQNPRSAQAWRILAASLAKLGDLGAAKAAMREALVIEPQLTAPKLRARMKFMPDSVWAKYADCLRLAGLPE
jgi:TolB-like protein